MAAYKNGNLNIPVNDIQRLPHNAYHSDTGGFRPVSYIKGSVSEFEQEDRKKLKEIDDPNKAPKLKDHKKNILRF